MTIGIAVLSLNAEKELPTLLPTLLEEKEADRIVVFDSESADKTVEIVKSYPKIELCSIKRSDFNHGATREFARKHLGTDIVVFLTQDIIPIKGFLRPLIDPVLKNEASVTYARQLPHKGADIFEAFPRLFNYPEQTHTRSLKDTGKYGVFTFFCSDSCSAYSNLALNEIGGIKPILTNEDYFSVASILKNGGKITYVAESQVHHSHRYTLIEEFKRYFDTGYVRGTNKWVNQLAGQAEGHGSQFAKAMLSYLRKNSPSKIPYFFLQILAKWLGYRMGYFGYLLPASLCKNLSSQGYFWSGKYNIRK